MFIRRLLIVLALFLSPAPLVALVEGVVSTPGGQPVEHAWVGTGAATTHTDANGRFRLEVEPPIVLVVHHPRFEPLDVAVGSGRTEPLAITLEPKQTVYEEIVVSTERGSQRVAPVSVAASRLDPAADAPAAATLTEAIEQVPGVAENGQGGLFQTYSVRGVSRYRILTEVAGMPIVAERRAGVSASFVDPRLMGAAEILRGPASTAYGSGALGGVVQVLPRTGTETWTSLGWRSSGNERYLAGGGTVSGWTLGLALRAADDAEAADGTRLNSHFRQGSAMLTKEWRRGERSLRLTLLPSYGDDIGKASTRYPEVNTSYPLERHLVASLEADLGQGWRARLAAHPNDLVTRELEDGGRDEVFNEALDFALAVDRETVFDNGLFLQTGLDWFARRGVTSEEHRYRATDDTVPDTVLLTLDDARRDDLAAFALLRGPLGRATLQGGARFTWQQQRNADDPARDDTAVNAFLGTVLPLAGGVELAANFGNGLRFPSLSERFFSGTTGRGEVIGNPALEPESSLNLDLGFRFYGRRLYLVATAFRNDIDDYIERIEIAPDLLTFVNLTGGTIQGVEFEGSFEPSPRWRVRLSGQTIEGRSDADLPLNDIPADRIEAGVRLRSGAVALEGRWQHRFDKDDPGSGEKEIAGADLVRLRLQWEIRPGLLLAISGDNLLDEEYYNSADQRVPLAPGRAFGLSLALELD